MLNKTLARFKFWLKSVLMSFGPARKALTGLEIMQKETYLAMVQNSIGTQMFRSMIARKNNGEVEDILRDGDYSCAFFVSTILRICEMLRGRTRTTVRGLREYLTHSSNWEEINCQSIEPGDIIFWERVTFADGSSNEHVGIALSQQEAVSTSDSKKMVVNHHINFDFVFHRAEKSGLQRPSRRIIQVFRYKFR